MSKQNIINGINLDYDLDDGFGYRAARYTATDNHNITDNEATAIAATYEANDINTTIIDNQLYISYMPTH